MNRPVPTYRCCILFLTFIIGSLSVLRSQTTDQAAYLNWFDEQVGIENTALYEGIIYKETYRTINEKVKFYKSSQWFKGSVIYSGQLFSNVQLKYDVFGDQLIIKQLDRLGGGALLLFKDKITEFNIEESRFVNVSDVYGGSDFSGFFELLWESNGNRLLAKHLKNDFLRKDRSATYYEFVDLKKEYVLHRQGNYYQLKGKKELIRIYPDLKKQIDSFYQNNRRLRSRNLDGFMVSLITTLEEFSSGASTDAGQ